VIWKRFDALKRVNKLLKEARLVLTSGLFAIQKRLLRFARNDKTIFTLEHFFKNSTKRG